MGFSASQIVWQAIPSGGRRDRRQPARSSWSAAGAPVAFLPYARLNAPAMARLAGASIRRRSLVLREVYDRALDDASAVAEDMIAIERIRAPVLLISGADDQVWPSGRLAEIAMAHLAEHEHPYHDEHLHYEEAGHLAGRLAQPRRHGSARPRLALGGTASGDVAGHASPNNG